MHLQRSFGDGNTFEIGSLDTMFYAYASMSAIVFAACMFSARLHAPSFIMFLNLSLSVAY